jgi:hypothetical protein
MKKLTVTTIVLKRLASLEMLENWPALGYIS